MCNSVMFVKCLSTCVALQCYIDLNIARKKFLRKFQYGNHEIAKKVSVLDEKPFL